ncbi:unnamed protein product, partial [Prorocentrum cordatum]
MVEEDDDPTRFREEPAQPTQKKKRGEMLRGFVRKFFQDSGFGWITPSDYSGDVFVHRKVLNTRGTCTAYLEEGDEVTFEKEFDETKGKWEAAWCDGPWRVDGGEPFVHPSEVADGKARLGTLMKWDSERGFGFIRPEVEDNGAGRAEDVFCHASALLDGKDSVREGDQVRFQVTQDASRGRLAAEVELASTFAARGGRSRSRRARRGEGPEVRSGDWECPKCGTNVFATKAECFKCGERKPNMKRGEWACPKCGASVFASRAQCFKCKTLKPDMKPGDWACPACGACVYSNRLDCFKCGVRKPDKPDDAGSVGPR